MFHFFSKTSLAFLLILFSLPVFSQGDLLITPKRLVFEGNKRIEEINLANIGKDSATYTISFTQYKMNEDGSFEQIPDTDTTQRFAHRNLRFFPRTVTLAPKEAQSVKVQVIRINELQTGEYRSHLFFRAVPRKKALGEEPAEVKADSGISIKLTPVYGISIPLIIRVGETAVAASITNTLFSIDKQTAKPVLKLTLNRTGNISAYGDITVTHISKDNKITQVGFLRGLAVYLPNTKRNISMLLEKSASVDFASGKLRVVYSDQSPKPQSICEQEILL
ncbi:MAG: hypothetical protein WAT19_07070 [Ferruginibacter sp.]